MLRVRDIRLSLKKRVYEMFIAPHTDTGWASAFNVYDEDQFRGVINSTFTPTKPYIYLLDDFLLPAAQRLDLQQPQVVVEIEEAQSKPFEMGNRKGRDIQALIHVFGQNRAQRDDLGAYIMDYIGNTIKVHTFSASSPYPDGVYVEDALVLDPRTMRNMYTPRLEQYEATGILLGWSIVSINFLPKQ